MIVSGHGEMLAPIYFAQIAPGIGEMMLAMQDVPVNTFSEDHYEHARLAYRLRGSRKTLLKNARLTLWESRAMFNAFDHIEAPVLQIHGTEDEEIPQWAMRKTHARYPERGRELVLIEGSHHFVMFYNPDAYLAAVLKFLEPRNPQLDTAEAH